MKNMPRRRGWLAAVILVLACSSSPAAARNRVAAACELAQVLFKAAGDAGQTVLLRPGPFEMVSNAETAPLGGAGAAPGPSSQLAWAWSRAPRSTLIEACPDLVEQSRGVVRLATADEVRRSKAFRDPAPVTLQQFSAPVFNDAYTEALIGWGYQCPGLCAGQGIHYFRKVGGAWKLLYSWPLMFS